MENLLTPDQLAEYLQVPAQTLPRWRHSGTGPKFIKVGRHCRYRRSDVEAWLQEQEAEAPDA